MFSRNLIPQNQTANQGNDGKPTVDQRDVKAEAEAAKRDENRKISSDKQARTQRQSFGLSLLKTGYCEYGIGQLLQRNNSREADTIRLHLLQRSISNGEVDENIAIEALKSLSFTNSAIGTELRQAMTKQPFVDANGNCNREFLSALVCSFEGCAGAQDQKDLSDFLTQFRINEHSLEDSLRTGVGIGVSGFDYEKIIMGTNTPVAQMIRAHLDPENQVASVRGMKTAEAWKIRKARLAEIVNQKKDSPKEDIEKIIFGNTPRQKLQDLLLGLTGDDSTAAVQFRRDALSLAEADPADIYLSLTGTTSEEGIALRKEAEELILKSITSVSGYALLDAIYSDDSDPAWQMRGELYKAVRSGKYQEISIEDILHSLGSIKGEKAELFLHQVIDDGLSESTALSVLNGSELEGIWKIREKLFAELKEKNQFKARDMFEQLEDLPPAKKQMAIARLKEHCRSYGIYVETKTDKELVEFFREVETYGASKDPDKRELFEKILFGVTDESGTFTIGDPPAWAFARSHYEKGDIDRESIISSLRGLTSVRAANFLTDMKKEGLDLYDQCRCIQDVFTPEANKIRSEALNDLRGKTFITEPGQPIDSKMYALARGLMASLTIPPSTRPLIDFSRFRLYTYHNEKDRRRDSYNAISKFE